MARSSPPGISKPTLASVSARFARTMRWAIAPSETRKARAISSVVNPPTMRKVRAMRASSGQQRMAGGEDQAEQIVAEVVVEGRGRIGLLA